LATISGGGAMLGIGGGTGAGFAATKAKATSGNANSACFNAFPPRAIFY
jgi:hypothetical protein